MTMIQVETSAPWVGSRKSWLTSRRMTRSCTAPFKASGISMTRRKSVNCDLEDARVPNEKSKESSLWKWLKQAESWLGTDLHMERIENSAGLGTPDVHGCFRGAHFTIELKSVARKRVIHFGISPYQDWWARRRKE